MSSVLVYHSISAPADPMPGDIDISPERFERQALWMARSGKVVPLTHTLEKSRSAIAITFDDGYRDNLTVALPVLEKFGLPMTLFVAAGLVDSDAYLSTDELREISRHPLVTIGAHGYWHRHFDRMTRDEARVELIESRLFLESAIGEKVDLMAWPYGECNRELEELSAAAGYRAAWSVWKGNNGAHCRWRVPLGRRDHLLRFIAKAAGLYGLTEARLHRFQERRRQRVFSTDASAGRSRAEDVRVGSLS